MPGLARSVALLLLALCAAAGPAHADSVADGITPARTGVAADGPAGPLSLAWSGDAVTGTIALVADGRLITADHPLPVIGSTQPSRFVARDLATGELLWQRAFSAPLAPPLLPNGGTRLATDSGRLLSVEGTAVRALDAATGRPLWVREADPHVHDVIAADGRVYVAGIEADGATITALAADDGHQLWSVAAPGVGIAAGHGLVVVDDPDCGALALDAADGSTTWSQMTCRADIGESAHTPVITAQRVFLQRADGLHVVATADGHALRTDALDLRPAVSDIEVGLSDADSNPRVRALDPATGLQLWVSEPLSASSLPTLAGGLVWVATSSAVSLTRTLVGLSPLTGAQVTSFDLPDAPSRPLYDTGVVAGGGALVGFASSGAVRVYGGAAPIASATPDPQPAPAPPTPLERPVTTASPRGGASGEGRLDVPPLTGVLHQAWSYGDPIPRSITVLGDVALIPERSQPAPFEQAFSLRALDVQTGRPLWRTLITRNSAPNADGVAIGAAGYRAFISDASDGLTAVDARTGEILWQRTRPNTDDREGIVVADGDDVLVAGETRLVMFDAATGAVRWNVAVTRFYAPVMDATRVYLRGGCTVLSRATGVKVAGVGHHCDDDVPPFGALTARIGDTVVSGTEIRDAATLKLRDVRSIMAGDDVPLPVDGGLLESSIFDGVWLEDGQRGVRDVDTGSDITLPFGKIALGDEQALVPAVTFAGAPDGHGMVEVIDGASASVAQRLEIGYGAGSEVDYGGGTVMALVGNNGSPSNTPIHAVGIQAGGSGPRVMPTVAPAKVMTPGTTGMSFGFLDAADGADCRVDSDDWQPCTSPWVTTLSVAGLHHLDVRARLGSTTGPSTTAWVAVDDTAPDTRFTTPPADWGNAPQYVVDTDAADHGTAAYSCRLDSEDWKPCPADFDLGRVFGSIATGPHTISVRATDEAGNTDQTPVTATYTEDHTPPAGTIQEPGDAVGSHTIPIRFSADEPVTGECVLVPEPQNDPLPAFTPCASPSSRTVPADGSYRLYVRFTDRAGNFTYATKVTKADTVPPQIHMYDVQSPWTYDELVVEWSGNEPIASWSCTYDGAPLACTNVAHLNRLQLTDGSHTVVATGTDSAGNSASGTLSFVADRPPVTTITDPPGGRIGSAPFTVHYTSDKPVASYECYVDNVLTPCDASGITLDAPEGHTVELQVRGITANHVAGLTPATRSWLIDERAPQVTMSEAPAVTNASSLRLTLSADEPASWSCSFDGAAQDCAGGEVELTDLGEGTHTLIATGSDGERAGSASRTFRVDRRPPRAAITGPAAGRVTSTTFTATYVSSEDGSTFRCTLNGAPLDCPAAQVQISGANGSTQALAVRAVDAAGNVSAAATRTWTIQMPPATTPITRPPVARAPTPDAELATLLKGARSAVSGRGLRTLLIRGSKGLRVSADLPGRYDVTVKYGSTTVAKGRATPTAAGRFTLRLKATKAGRKLRKARVKLKVTAIYTGADGRRTTSTTSVIGRRRG